MSKYQNDLFFKLLSTHGEKFTSKYIRILKDLLLQQNSQSSMEIGFELEFYLRTFGKHTDEEILQRIFEEHEGTLLSIKKEEGRGQYEAVFTPSEDICTACENLTNFCLAVSKITAELESIVYFQSQPFRSQPSSAMQVSLSFTNEQGQSTISSTNPKDTAFIETFINGLLSHLNESMVFLAPTARCYDKFLEEEITGVTGNTRNTPHNICWGYSQNRTVAIRVIKDKEFSGLKSAEGTLFSNEELERRYKNTNDRIELRYLSAMANPKICLVAILTPILSQKKENPEEKHQPIYGNAFEEEIVKYHALRPIVSTVKQAHTAFENSQMREFLNHNARVFAKFLPVSNSAEKAISKKQQQG